MDYDILSKLSYKTIKDEQKKLLNKILDDVALVDELNKLNIDKATIENNLATISAFADDFHTCNNCKGLEVCPKHPKGTRIKLVNLGKIIERQIEECELKQGLNKIDNHYLINDYPNKFKYIDINDIDVHSLDYIGELATNIADGLRSANGTWIYVLGASNNRKIQSVAGIVNQIVLDSDVEAAAVSTSNLIKKLSDLFFKDKDRFDVEFDNLCQVPILIFLDFGDEYKNESSRDNIFIPLLRARKNHGVTIFISAFFAKEVAEMYNLNYASKPRVKQIEDMFKNVIKIDFGPLDI